MDRYNWAGIPQEKLNPRMIRQVVHSPQATIARLWLGKGALVPHHQHVNQQITIVTSGRLQFDMDGKRFELGPGDVLVIPPHMPHTVEALEDAVVTDFFTPAREDWIRGDDAYLRR
jgi:quercetin dioxygenase-like cupin family protein